MVLNVALSDFAQAILSLDSMLSPGKLIVSEEACTQTLQVLKAPKELQTIIGCMSSHISNITHLATVEYGILKNETALIEYGRKFRETMEGLEDTRIYICVSFIPKPTFV